MLAATAIAADHNGIAELALLRLLWAHPNHAGARLDLALLALKQGDRQTAATHLDWLQQNTSPPAELQPILDQLEHRIKAASLRPPHWELGIGLGYDSNANLGMTADELTLNLNGQWSELTLAGDSRPQSDLVSRLQLRNRFSISSTQLVQLQLSRQHFMQSSSERDLYLSGQLQLDRPGNQHWRIDAQYMGLDTSTYVASLGLELEQPFALCTPCTLTSRADFLNSNQDSVGPLTLQLGLSHRAGTSTLQHHTQARLSWQHQPDAGWGDTLGLELNHTLLLPTNTRLRYLQTQLRLAYDQHAYSPFFGSAQRDPMRFTLALGQRNQLTPHWSLQTEYRYTNQQSDIALYEYTRHQLMFSIFRTL